MALVEDAAPFPAASSHESGRMHRTVLMSQLDEKLRSAPEIISERDRSVFWLYYLQGLTAEEIARVAASGLTAKGVESALRRVAKWLRGEVGGRKPEEQPETG
jgi:RNA polymerase sigma-70 factor (ECF subfamily)